MKNKVKLPLIAVLGMVMAFLMAACVFNIDDGGSQYGIDPYIGKKTAVVSGEQVWIRNQYATKISQAYLQYNGSPAPLKVFVFKPAEPKYEKISVGSGQILNGILDFGIENLEGKTDLSGWEAEKLSFFKSIFSMYWKNVQITPDSTEGYMILLETPSDMLDRQGLFGTASTISCETILYIYVNENCTISGEANQGYIPGQYYYRTDGNLHLSLREGLNLVCRRETYGTDFSGSAVISMSIRNPIKNPENYKWVIELGYVF